LNTGKKKIKKRESEREITLLKTTSQTLPPVIKRERERERERERDISLSPSIGYRKQHAESWH